MSLGYGDGEFSNWVLSSKTGNLSEVMDKLKIDAPRSSYAIEGDEELIITSQGVSHYSRVIKESKGWCSDIDFIYESFHDGKQIIFCRRNVSNFESDYQRIPQPLTRVYFLESVYTIISRINKDRKYDLWLMINRLSNDFVGKKGNYSIDDIDIYQTEIKCTHLKFKILFKAYINDEKRGKQDGVLYRINLINLKYYREYIGEVIPLSKFSVETQFRIIDERANLPSFKISGKTTQSDKTTQTESFDSDYIGNEVCVLDMDDSEVSSITSNNKPLIHLPGSKYQSIYENLVVLNEKELCILTNYNPNLPTMDDLIFIRNYFYKYRLIKILRGYDEGSPGEFERYHITKRELGETSFFLNTAKLLDNFQTHDPKKDEGGCSLMIGFFGTNTSLEIRKLNATFYECPILSCMNVLCETNLEDHLNLGRITGIDLVMIQHTVVDSDDLRSNKFQYISCLDELKSNKSHEKQLKPATKPAIKPAIRPIIKSYKKQRPWVTFDDEQQKT